MVKVPITTMIPQNGRTVRLLGDILGCKPTQENNEIVSIECTGEAGPFEIAIGETVRVTPSSPYKVNKIVEGTFDNKVVCYDLITAALTDSSIFILPLLGGNRRLFMWDSLFVNAFIQTEEHKNCIALLYRYSGDMLFLKFESALCSFRTFRERFDPDPNHVMFIFDVPKEAQDSYESFVNGKYSEIDDMWKLKILSFHDFAADGQTGQILFKSKYLKHSLEEKIGVELAEGTELHSKPDLKTEGFDAEYYKPALKTL